MSLQKLTVRKSTPHGKGIRTVYQSFLSALPFIIGILTIPDIAKAVQEQPVWFAVAYAVLLYTLTYIQNKRGL